MTDDYTPIITRLPAALEDEREAREEAERLLHEAELARVEADAATAERLADEQAATEAAGYEADKERLANEP